MRIRHLAHEALDFNGTEVEEQKAGASLISICPHKMGISNGVVELWGLEEITWKSQGRSIH